MTPDLIIFDCDGVLVDSEPVVNGLLAQSLTAHGLPLTAEECMDLFVGGTMIGVEQEARARGADLPPDWLPQIYAAMYRRLDEGVDVIPGVLDLIAAAEARGVALAVASNGPVEKMRHSLTPSGLFTRFGDLLLSREGHAPKPEPDMLIHAMTATGAARDRTVMIDDSPSGCLAARNAGVRCFGYATRGQGESLAAVGAEVVTSMDDIARAIGLAP